MFKRRVGPNIHSKISGSQSPNVTNCPDIWELDNGDFAIIGLRKTSVLRHLAPQDVSCGPDEEIVVIPRKSLISAKSDIPGE